MRWRLVVVAGLACVHMQASVEALAQADAPAMALVTTYADGRVTESLVPPTGFRAWTPYFPRLERWRDPDGTPPVRALNLRATAEGQRLHLRVSVLRGPAHEIEQPVTELFVDLDTPVVVDAVTRVGLRPLTFSAKRFAAPALHVPRGASRVEGLIVEGVEPFLEPAPGYRISLRNHTDVGAVTVAFEAFAGGQRSLRGQQGHPSAETVVAPGGTYTFTLGLRGGRETGGALATVTPLDEVVIAGVIWADGRVAGDQSRMGTLLALHRGRMSTVSAIIDILRQSRGTGDPHSARRRVREAIVALPIDVDAVAVANITKLVPAMTPREKEDIGPAMSTGSQNVRQRLVADIDRVLPSTTADDAQRWLDEALPACEAWLARLQSLFALR